MNWWEWVFSGIGVLFISLLIQRWVKPSPERKASLMAQGAKVSGSPVASGSGIMQTVNEVHHHYAQPSSESGRSEIHKLQVQSLLSIQAKLEEALFYLQRATAAGRFTGEASDQELLNRMAESLGAASTEFAKNRLIFSESIGKRLDEFFNKMVSASITLRIAFDPMVQDGNQRAKLWDQARDAAYKGIPPLLNAFRDEARSVIHG